jgi:membrane dipeptidase
MLVDLSHVHVATMVAAIGASRAPVIFSHSSSRAVCDHVRDVPDHVLQLVSANGGLVMVTFVSDFVAGKFWVRGGKVGATVIEVADHVCHIADVAGVDHVGVGGDYDGCESLARGLRDVSCYPNLTAELLHRGWSDEDVRKVLSGNAIRVLRAAEAVRDRMRAEGCLPCEARFDDGDGA